jgi:serine/threonine protein kinase
MTLPKGARLGPYQVVVPIGAGGMGKVYKARDTRLGRDVAIKELLPAKMRGDAGFETLMEPAREEQRALEA